MIRIWIIGAKKRIVYSNRPIRKIAGCCLAGICLSGCSSIWDAHTQKDDMVEDYLDGRFDSGIRRAEKKLESARGSGDELMWLLELGSLYFYNRRYPESIAIWQQADALVEEYDNRAVVSVRDVGAEAGAMATNLNALPYRGFGHDRIMLPIFKALAQLGRGDEELMLVNLRRMRSFQDRIAERYASEIAKEKAQVAMENLTAVRKLGELAAGGEKNEKNSEPGGEPLAALQENADFKERLAAIELQARNAYGNFLNPLAIFLSGLGYLRENDWENAYIDFKRLYEAMPDNELIRKYFVTVLQQTRRPVPAVLASVEPFRMALDRSSVYLIFANGRGAAFTEKKYEITVPYLGYTGIAFPVCEYYPRPFGKVAALTGSDWTETVPVADMDAIVSQEYTERLPAMITRLVVNYLVKETASLLISQSASTADEAVRYLTYFGTGIYKYLFNTADTRSWELLPGEFQIGQLPMPSDHRLEVQLLAPDGRTVLRQTTVNFGEQCRSAIVYVNAPSQKNWDCLVLEFYDQ